MHLPPSRYGDSARLLPLQWRRRAALACACLVRLERLAADHKLCRGPSRTSDAHLKRAQDLLTKHKILCAEHLEKNYDQVFGQYRELLDSENYVTRRQSLKLLGELLLDRANFTVMTIYIGNPENLKLMMNLLRAKSRNIQVRACALVHLPARARCALGAWLGRLVRGRPFSLCSGNRPSFSTPLPLDSSRRFMSLRCL